MDAFLSLVVWLWLWLWLFSKRMKSHPSLPFVWLSYQQAVEEMWEIASEISV